MTDYKITVLVTFYNQEEYVDQALESVFMQETDFPFNVIVGDDGSTDNTGEKVRAWQEKYPGRLSIHVQDREPGKKYIKGARASRNRLEILKKVVAPYFIFLDGDDYWTSSKKLQKQYDILEKEENSDCVGCAHRIRMFNENTPDRVGFIPGNSCRSGKYSLKRYWSNYYFHTDTILFRSSRISDLRWDLIQDSFNDNLITYSFLQFGPLYFISECMADYRQNDKGIWAGEDLAVCMIREIMAYDLEIGINPEMRRICRKRHLKNFNYYKNDPAAFERVEKEYLETAEKNNCMTAQKALNRQSLFTGSFQKDRALICVWNLEDRMDHLVLIPYRIYRRLRRGING